MKKKINKRSTEVEGSGEMERKRWGRRNDMEKRGLEGLRKGGEKIGEEKILRKDDGRKNVVQNIGGRRRNIWRKWGKNEEKKWRKE